MSWDLKSLEESLIIGSTLVEGSTLTEAEAGRVLAGKTVQGHPVTEIRELLNYRSAVERLMAQLSRSPYLSRDLVLEFHDRLLQGFPGTHGRWKTSQNYTYLSDGNRHDFLHPGKVDSAVRAWLERFNSDLHDSDAPVEVAARLYYDFEQIHPFDDGNGRIGRILIAYWLHWKARLRWTFRLKDKIPHLQALEAANRGSFRPLIRFFQERTSKERS